MITTKQQLETYIDSINDSIRTCRIFDRSSSKYDFRLNMARTVLDYIGTEVSATEYLKLPEVVRNNSTLKPYKVAEASIKNGKVYLHHYCNSWEEDIEGNERIFTVGFIAR